MANTWIVNVGAVLALCVVSLGQNALEWTPETYPNPQEEPSKCGRPYVNDSWVCDPNGLITVDEATVLDDIINDMIHHVTECPCSAYECERNYIGYFIGIALMKKMKLTPNEPRTEETLTNAALKFAYDLESTYWKYGTCEQSVIIVFSRDDGRLYTMTGGTARLTLADPLVEKITSDHWKHFQPGEDLSVGLKDMVKDFRSVFQGRYYGMYNYKDYVIGGTTVMHPGNVVYYISSLLGTLLLTWLLHW